MKHGIFDFLFSISRLAPKGWHIPTDEEFNELISFLGGNDQAAQKLKSNNGWDNYIYKTGGDNITCKNCKDWNDEYRRQVPCHVCKDTKPEVRTEKSVRAGKREFVFDKVNNSYEIIACR